MPLNNGPVMADTLNADLTAAEIELYRWATGERSHMNEFMSVENDDRQVTLVHVAQADAAEVELLTNRVLALRLLLSS